MVPCYAAQAKEFPGILMGLLAKDAMTIPSSLRRCLVQCLLLVRKKKLIALEPVLTLFFRLFRVKDKQLREMLYDSIIGEIKRANTPHRNNALNKGLQNFMFSMLHQQAVSNAGQRSANDSAEGVGSHKALQVMIELYRRNIWNDSKTVNVVAEACTAQISYKVTVTALNFFLGRCKRKSAMSLADEEEASEEESEEEEGGEKKGMPSVKEMMYKMQVAGATKARKTKMKRFMAAKKKAEAEKNSSAGTDAKGNAGAFSAVHLLNDPYGFVEKLFAALKRSTDSFEFKLLMLNVISRVIGAHKLIFLDLYSFLLKYIQPHQKNVTQVLAYAAQASHDLVPPDVIAPLVKAIANNFISEHCRPEVIAAGLNGLTHICTRCPLAMDAVLLQDLANYKGFSDKAVMNAARSLISLYREKNPELLHRKDRGRDASMALQRGEFAGPKGYGHTDVACDVAGAELLDVASGSASDAEDDDGWAECSADGLSDSGSEEEDADGDDGFVDLGSDAEAPFDDESSGSSDASGSSDDEPGPVREKAGEVSRMLSMAAQKIFTPQDFALLKRRRLEAAVESATAARQPPKKLSRTNKALPADADLDSDADEQDGGPSEVVRASAIEAHARKQKADYATRMASIKAGREGRLEFGSKKGKDSRGSKTNAEKSKAKNAIMMSHKYEVRMKKQRSLREVSKVQRAHIKRQKLKRK